MASAAVWCIFLLQDGVLTGLRHATWVPIGKLIFSVGKIVLLLMLAGLLPRLGIFASWTVAAVVTILPINLLIFARLVAWDSADQHRRVETLRPRQLTNYAALDYVGQLFSMATTGLLPVLVLQLEGSAANLFIQSLDRLF